MGQLTNFTEKKILDHVLKVASYSPPATVYLGLSTADPTHDGSGWANPTYTGYARKAITFAAAGSRAIAQTGAVTFDPCTVGTSTVGWWGIWDQLATGGNLLAYGTLSPPKEIVVGNAPSVATGLVTVSFTAGAVFTGLVNSVLDWLFRAQTLSQPTHVKVGLSTTTPADAGTNITEPSNNYAQVNFDTWNAAAILGSTTVNGTSDSGQAVLQVASTTSFVVGNRVLIGDGTARFEVGVILSIQAGVSLTLTSNLTYTHTAGQADTVVSPETAQNNGTITMPTPSGTWGLITHGVVYLDTTKAFYGTVPNQTPDNGDTVEWLTTTFSVSIQ